MPGRTLPAETAAEPEQRASPKPRLAAPAIARPKPLHHIPPQDRGGEKRVRRGQVEIAASIDLHGYTQDRAQAALSSFLRRQHAEGARVVIAVTGKGRGGEEGVLRRRLPHWLDAPDIRSLIAGYAQAHRNHGGAGAYYVFLKRPRED
jgi:DNA-nicking Smr family endonuclease